MQVIGLTDTGKVRDNNEDSYAVYSDGIHKLPNLAIVADGMGGHQSGEVASQSAIEFFLNHVKQTTGEIGDILDFLMESVQIANKSVYEKSLTANEYSGMGTTFTACVVSGGKGYVAHVGDSRLYIVKNKELSLITTDHSYVNEMVKAGQITEAEALVHPRRNALTKALGVSSDVEVDGYVFEFDSECIIFMCSDGLTNMVSDAKIYEVLTSGKDIENCGKQLIEAANLNGGIDNITVVLAKAKR